MGVSAHNNCLEYGTKKIVYDAVVFPTLFCFHDQSTAVSCYNLY